MCTQEEACLQHLRVHESIYFGRGSSNDSCTNVHSGDGPMVYMIKKGIHVHVYTPVKKSDCPG